MLTSLLLCRQSFSLFADGESGQQDIAAFLGLGGRSWRGIGIVPGKGMNGSHRFQAKEATTSLASACRLTRTRSQSPNRAGFFARISMMKNVAAKLYPTKSQGEKLRLCLESVRWVYNKSLEHKIKAWKRRQHTVGYSEQCRMLATWRQKISSLAKIPSESQRDGLRRVRDGFKAFFRRLNAGESPGFPRFKPQHRYRSYTILQAGRYVWGNRVYVPGVGKVICRGLVAYSGKIKGIRVVRKSSGWHVHLIIDDGLSPPKKPISSMIGIDVGLASFATFSDGTKIDNPRWYKSLQPRLRFLQRKSRNKVINSTRRKKASEIVSKLYERISNTRKDWIHKLSRKIVNEFDLIAIENLDIGELSQKRFSKSILDAAWGEFALQLEYKAANAGKQVVRVDPRGTSQECSACGATVQKTLRDRVHSCSCGYVADRDENAAKNILRRATPEFTREERCLLEGRSLNREESC